jgi:hypothetical protein
VDFEAVGRLVDAACAKWKSSAGPETCIGGGERRAAQQCRDCLSDSYYGGSPSYGCSRFRWMYLWSYFPTNVFAIWNLLCSNTRGIVELLGADRTRAGVSAASIGCGPGCDLLGLYGWIEDVSGRYGQWGPTALHGMDRAVEWKSIVSKIIRAYCRVSEGAKPECTIDFTEIPDARDVRLGDDVDMLLMSRVWSELGYSQAEATEYLGELVASSSSLRILAFIDRTDAATVELVDEVVEAVEGLTLLDRDSFEENCRVHISDDTKSLASPQWNCNHSRWLVAVDPR